eukprot:TRINITY_DN14087_c0_g1_i2.p1 TRINITY_DN14087_c0_g1~~TRINITY_DN14087_c0_g1_i2.p1  ORF type:complete len:433 (+),score=178.76 TRINITY_DN14087_c0_g1_i2:93-1391(+)
MSDAVVATLTAGEQAHLIEQRREVRDKFNELLYRLEVIKRLGEPSFGDNPEQYLRSMKIDDATFNTDIPSELRRIEVLLREQKLEQQWKKEGRGAGLGDEQQAMQDWVHGQLEQGAASEVQLKLPYKAKLNTHMDATIANKNDDYETSLLERDQQAHKGPGDRVQYNGRNAMVLKVARGMCEVRWDKKDPEGEETSMVPASEVYLLSKAHPALAITAESRTVERYLRGRQRNTAQSTLASLFSDPDGSTPAFLQTGTDGSRRAVVERSQRERRSKMMIARTPQPGSSRATSSRSKLNVQSKFREKPPFAQPGAQEMQISKEDGKPLGLIFDPETLCLLEAQKDTPAEAFDKFRGMRITHVSTRDDPQFSNDEGVHSAAQLRKALGRAQESQDVAVRFETWTQRRAVEKKKREFREKLISHRDKAMKDRATRD